MEHPCLNSKWFLFPGVLLLWITSGLESATISSNAYESDRLDLLDFKNRITQDPLQIMDLWNDPVHFCDWFGVTCSPPNERVIVLNLEDQKLVGIIPPSIGILTSLTGINLRKNSFHGEIPQEIGRLQRLQHLNLTYNLFSGKVPTNLTHCKEITVLNLSHNEFVGQIEDQLSSLSKLVLLRIGGNNLTGSIPAWIGNFSSLQDLTLALNNLEGQIPNELGRLPGLGFFQLYGNYLSGTMPSSIYNISSIYYFSVAQNQLHGQLPPNVGLTLPNLQIFAGGVNNFTGPIPISLDNASMLGVFDFPNNSLTGPVPVNLGSLRGLYRLNLDDNRLGNGKTGELNFIDFLANCSALEVLGLTSNRFGGELRSSIANLSTQLKIFTMGDNLIHGSIPFGIGNLVNLFSLEFESNYLSGSVPDVLGKLNKLEGLHLNANIFSGSIPSLLGNLTQLTRLFMEENRFEGVIPSSLGSCKKLLVLDFSSNNLSGIIPKEVLTLSLSIYLSMSNNSLTGSLPFEVSNLHNRVELDISDNKLSGKIPSSLASCTSLERLHLQGNEFEGTIPVSLNSLRGLEEIDLSRNNLSGQIPDFLSKILPLRLLNLSYNNFEGELSREGLFANASAISVIGNDELCGGVRDLHLPACSRKGSVKGLSPKVVVSVTVTVILVIILSCSLVIYCMAKNLRRHSNASLSTDAKLGMSYSELVKSTDDFSAENLIGSGSFGSVYKGKNSREGTIIAVKVLNLLQQGASKSFSDECKVLRSIRHRNLLKIVTACSSIDHQGNEFKALVFEFMSNGNLDQWLHPRADQIKKLSFIERLNIAFDVASALDYLHHHCETPIIHCDLKPSNVLLDENMVAHVGDFGLARFLFEASIVRTVSGVLKGSIGYIPPEYGMGGQVSAEGDIYSYGILLLEMFTGKRPTDDMFKDDLGIQQFITMALPEHIMDIVDPSMLFEEKEENVDDRKKNEADIEEIRMIVNNDFQANARRKTEECLASLMGIGLLCSATLPRERMAMSLVVNKLHAIRGSFQRSI